MALGESLPVLPVPKPGERCVILGNTGEGKTVLAKALLRTQPHCIIVNTKHDPSFASLGRTIERDEAIFKVGPGRYDFRPSDAWVVDVERRDRFFRWCLKAGHRVIYCDEFGDVAPSAQNYPPALKACVTRGRWVELGIWGTTQEPIRVPSFLFGQAQHRYVFYLGLPAHQKIASEIFQAALPFGVPGGLEEQSHRFVVRTPAGVFGPSRLTQDRSARASQGKRAG